MTGDTPANDAPREIALDTETTGLDPAAGHRVVEIGCLELINHIPSGREYHTYVNPVRDMPAGAFEVHGLSTEFLADKQPFAAIAEEFLGFIGDAPLVIHNAEFDLRFLNAELERLDRPALERSRAIDTLSMARRKYPGAQASLDALCRRFEIDTSAREKHGALVKASPAFPLAASCFASLKAAFQASSLWSSLADEASPSASCPSTSASSHILV